METACPRLRPQGWPGWRARPGWGAQQSQSLQREEAGPEAALMAGTPLCLQEAEAQLTWPRTWEVAGCREAGVLAGQPSC